MSDHDYAGFYWETEPSDARWVRSIFAKCSCGWHSGPYIALTNPDLPRAIHAAHVAEQGAPGEWHE